MKKMAIVVIMLVMMMGIAWGAEIRVCNERNGADWKEESPITRAYWIEGFLTGVGVASEQFGRWTEGDVSKADNEVLLKIMGISKKSYLELAKKYKHLIIFITIEQLRDGLDKFYENYKNQKIATVDAIYIVKMEIEGERPELIEAQKRFLRMAPIDRFEKMSENRAKFNTGEISKDIYKNIKATQELYLKMGVFAEAKVENPTKVEDYSKTPLFCYGIYK
ncbi:MAG: hypothetical protein U9Q24_04510 [Candidatus Ratteibacteria bacterium]|nr:hypothetical protein [Candidatus Ratteibacteria bacterium]